MNKLSKEKRDKLMMVCLGAGGLLIALYMLVITAQQASLAEYTQKIDATKEKLTKAEHWMRMGPTVQTRLAACRKELEDKQEEMAPVDKFKWFYNTLEKFLAKYQVRLVDITREPEVGEVGVLPKFPFQAATFGVKLSARYHDFGKCLAEFENAFPYMRVQNLDLEPESGSKSGTKDSGKLEISGAGPEPLAITMRVVALIKPNTSL
jgi:hypothetical protein